MSVIHHLAKRGNGLAGQAHRVLESGSSHVPKWLEAGAALGIAKTGASAATRLARRNPGIAIALGVVGAGVLAYRFYRRRADAREAQAVGAIGGLDQSASDEVVAEVVEASGQVRSRGTKPKSQPKAKSGARVKPDQE